MPKKLTVLSATLIVASFTPWDFHWFIWIALVPWLATISRLKTWVGALKESLWLGFLMGLGGYYWIAWVLKEFAVIPWSLSILGMILFSLICQPQFLVFALVFHAYNRSCSKNGGAMFLMAAIITLSLFYTGVDWMVPKLFKDTLGHSLYLYQNLRQLADIGGAHLLTFLVFMVNLSVWHFLSNFKNFGGLHFLYKTLPETGHQACRHINSLNSAPLILSACLLGGGLAYGIARNDEVKNAIQSSQRKLQAAVIQGNIGDFDKIAAIRGIRGAAQKVVDTYLDLSSKAIAMDPKPDFLVWPETSYPSTFRTPHSLEDAMRDKTLERLAEDNGITLLFGGYDRANRLDYNSLFFLTPGSIYGGVGKSHLVSSGPGPNLEIYHKHILLLFGEYIPGADWFPWVKSQFPQVGYFGRGPGPEVFTVNTPNPKVPNVRIAPIICYEALFPDYVIKAARKGNELILNITNDSWFGPYGEPYLHLSLIVFRSIETRLPQLRATNTGISALIMPDGKITKRTSIGQPDVMSATIPLTEPIPTLMKKWGDWFGLAAFVISGMLLVVGVIFCKSEYPVDA
ncbi:MAG: apolipoprotein N-acyltransferase [Bdellovibrionota bacterium]